MKNKNPVVARDSFPSDLKVPLFAAGQMLRHDDLAALADYTRDVTRVVLRSLFGCGVVCGLCVHVEVKCGKLTVTVEPGVALDCQGDVIHVAKTATVSVDPDCEAYPLPDCLFVLLRGYRKSCAPRPVACSTDEDEVASTCTREQYWYEIQVRRELPECVCSCLAPKSDQTSAGDATSTRAEPASDATKKSSKCGDPWAGCYGDHELGKCTCGCPSCTSCTCEWILLAGLYQTSEKDRPWRTKHRVRRFVRPRLLDDRGCDDDEKDTKGDDHPSGNEPPAQPETVATSRATASRPRRRRSTTTAPTRPAPEPSGPTG
ncbi:MAG TPA: hypothetical protein VFD92_22625 [Candidatus Binatia bacterium]|nr:hypothetical protein [Candidatus Binatia bacterium]